MVVNKIHATFTETYDINTVRNELTMLGIHTPQATGLRRMFKGLFINYSKFRVLGCNFRLVCATRQELTPDLVSAGGDLDPRDVLNPILFKACTGEGLNALLDQIYNASEAAATNITGTTSGTKADSSIDVHRDTGTQALEAYYSLLADDSFRREHPQRGITVMGLKPKVHRIVSTQPFKWSVGPVNPTYGANPSIVAALTPDAGDRQVHGFGGESGSSDQTADPVNPSVFVSNGLAEMPWLDTAYSSPSTFYNALTGTSGTSTEVNKAYKLCANVPRVYMGCLILPPSLGTTVNLYYRMQMVWHLEFKDFRSAQDLLPVGFEIGNWFGVNGELNGIDPSNQELSGLVPTYFNYYHEPTKLGKEFDSFDSFGVESVDKVLEKVN